MKNLLVKFINNEQGGTTAIEYGLVAIGLSFAIIAIVQGIAHNAAGLLTALNSN